MLQIEIILNIKKSAYLWNSLRFFWVFSFFLLIYPLNAKEISVLPAAVSGEIPSYLRNEEEAGKEIARLTRHYLKRNYLTEITDENSVNTFSETENLSSQTKLTESTLNVLCVEWDSSFITKDSVDFGKPTLIQTEIFNCKNKSRQVIQSQIISNFVLAIEKHIEKSFRFLAPKYYDRTLKNDNIYHEVHFLFDTNGAYSYYRKDFSRSLDSLMNHQNLFLGITVIRKDKILTLPPALEHGDIKKVFDDVSWSGINKADSVLQAIQSLRLKLSSGKKTSKKLFLLLSGSAKDKSSSIILALNELRQLGIEIYVIIPNHSELTVIRELQKIARSSSAKILGVTDYQRIGTEEGYQQIFLNQFNLYFTNQEVTQPFQLDVDPFKKWDASLVRAAVEVVTPYNMAEAFEKISEKKVLERSEVNTNIESLIGSEIIKSDIDDGRYQNILLEARGEAIWLKIPFEMNIISGKEYLVRTSVMLDPFSSWGIKNIANETILMKPNASYPRTLVILPSKAKKFLEENKVKQFSGYIQGVVSVVKKK
ncbi:LIC10012 family protein [Leptospira ognonensis]|uniref:LIC10012 family protein n=1 Tax=Leptospira ognonensis TaxID=2484945 RepID=UPI001FE8F625|nr:hypothetical protein [Leptospira ognonensis]